MTRTTTDAPGRAIPSIRLSVCRARSGAVPKLNRELNFFTTR